jgi:hypothetical protein
MMKITHLVAAGVLAVGVTTSAARAQSLVGRWDGSTNTQQGKTPVTFTFDSTATGWKGSWNADAFGSGPMSVVEIKKDTVSFSFAIQTTAIDMQGTFGADHKTITGYIWVGGQDGGTFAVTRFVAKPPPTTTRH